MASQATKTHNAQPIIPVPYKAALRQAGDGVDIGGRQHHDPPCTAFLSLGKSRRAGARNSAVPGVHVWLGWLAYPPHPGVPTPSQPTTGSVMDEPCL
jgi:hypothetical protein